MDFRDIQFKIHHFDRLASTNIHAHEMLSNGMIEDHAVIWTDYQLAGKGQRGRVWSAQASENMLISIVLKQEIPVQMAFYLNKLVAICLYDLIDTLTVSNLNIKWPNDILVGKRKICGILIENSIQGQKINQSIIGIGLNVNQTTFPPFDREATSLKMELDRNFEIKELIIQFLEILKKRWIMLLQDVQNIDVIYHQRLYGRDRELNYLIEGKKVSATINKIDDNGQLHLVMDGIEKIFSERELTFID